MSCRLKRKKIRKADWDEIKSLVNVPLLLDGRNFLSKTIVEDAGFTYVGFGISRDRAHQVSTIPA